MTPAPHARKRPNITISMLEVLKKMSTTRQITFRADRNVMNGLVRRGLAFWSDEHEDRILITQNGIALIDTQYDALKQIIPNTRSQNR